ncbi:MAG: hypothetical protein WC711_03315 [Candidatus Staskawiczbacteria bacterium]|jgi:putative protease
MPAKKKIIKKVSRKIKSKIKIKINVKSKAEGKPVGKITHYFSNIDVAVINLVSPLKVGEKIRIIGGQETDFEQKVGSMQVEHKDVKVGKKGESVGIKIEEKVHEGYKVYKV